MKNILLASLLLVSLVFVARAQNQANSALNDQKRSQQFFTVLDSIFKPEPKVEKIWDHLTIISDSRLDTLLKIHIEQNRRDMKIKGYRVQIYKGSSREAANQAKSKFLARFPDYNVDFSFPSPDFFVRVGDFRTRSEALKLANVLKSEYKSLLIIECDINFPSLIKE